MLVPLSRSSRFGLAGRALGTFVAPEDGVLILGSPDGPAKTACSRRRLSSLISVMRRGKLCIVDSRVCRELMCSKACSSPINVGSCVGGRSILIGNFSGTFKVAK